MRKYISVLLGCFFVAMAVMPGAYSLWQKNIEAGGMVQIRQHHRVIEETAEKVETETANDGQSENELDDVGQSEKEQNDDNRNDDVPNDVGLNGDKHDAEVLGE